MYIEISTRVTVSRHENQYSREEGTKVVNIDISRRDFDQMTSLLVSPVKKISDVIH